MNHKNKTLLPDDRALLDEFKNSAEYEGPGNTGATWYGYPVFDEYSAEHSSSEIWGWKQGRKKEIANNLEKFGLELSNAELLAFERWKQDVANRRRAIATSAAIGAIAREDRLARAVANQREGESIQRAHMEVAGTSPETLPGHNIPWWYLTTEDLKWWGGRKKRRKRRKTKRKRRRKTKKRKSRKRKTKRKKIKRKR